MRAASTLRLQVGLPLAAVCCDVGQRVGDLAERRLDRLLVAATACRCARLGRLGARGVAPRSRISAATAPKPSDQMLAAAGSASVDKRRALAAGIGGQRDRREHRRPGDADLRVGGDQLLLGLRMSGRRSSSAEGSPGGGSGGTGSDQQVAARELQVEPAGERRELVLRQRALALRAPSAAATHRRARSAWFTSRSEAMPPRARLRTKSSASSRLSSVARVTAICASSERSEK